VEIPELEMAVGVVGAVRIVPQYFL